MTKLLAAQVPNELANQVRELELQRLDELWRSMYKRAVAGDPLAVDRCLAIMKRRARYLGLDAPQQAQQVVITDDDIEQAIARMEAQTDALLG